MLRIKLSTKQKVEFCGTDRQIFLPNITWQRKLDNNLKKLVKLPITWCCTHYIYHFMDHVNFIG